MRSQALQGWQSFSNQTHTSTLFQEARNTERHGFAFENSTRLRDNRVQFVSAGRLGMTKGDSEEDDVEGDALERDDRPNSVGETNLDKLDGLPSESPSLPHSVPNSDFDDHHAAMTDQVERMEIVAEPLDPKLATVVNEIGLSSSRPRSTSKSSVASEEEVIVFGGRRAQSSRPVQPPDALTPKISVPVIENETTAVGKEKFDQSFEDNPTMSTHNSVFGRSSAAASSSENPPSAETSFLEPKPNFGRRRPRRRQLSDHETGDEARFAAAAIGPEETPPITEGFRKPRPNFGRRRGHRRGPTQQEIEEEALIQDYIANMKGDETDEQDEEVSGRNQHLRLYDGAGDENFKVRTQPRSKEQVPDMLEQDLEWSSGDLEDFDGMSTTDEEIAEVGCVYADRLRPSGFQYLVTAMGKGPSDACWVLGERLISTNDTAQIRTFEKRREAKLDPQNDAPDDSSTDSDEDEVSDDLKGTMESEGDENERLFQRTARMTDAQIAQALDMQDKLGMPTDQVLLFNGEENNEFADGDDFISFPSTQRISNGTRSTRDLRKKYSFPSAEAFADALDQDPYNGFDVMDFSRPSLKPKRKGRKSAGLPFELEDEELAFQLQQSWGNDRSKKAARKREREEIRQAGILGSKAANGKVDLHTRYQASGMDADQIRAEIRSFMVQEVEALALAPMAADMRASVHRLARALNLKSHSQGKGDGRFPILTKTPNTSQYTVKNVAEIDALLNLRKFFGRNIGSLKASKLPRSGPKTRRSGGAGVLAGASYMDGEVVGASAPEIGADNRGRAMLEKMGWSSGMGIGKVGNKGSTEVIKHVVKNTKAGLG